MKMEMNLNYFTKMILYLDKYFAISDYPIPFKNRGNDKKI